MKKLNFFFTLLLFGAVAQAQTFDGSNLVNDPAGLQTRLQQQLEHAQTALERGNAVTYVPIFFHLVGDANSEGKISKVRILNELCQLNTFFQPHDLQFFIQPHLTDGAWFGADINNNDVFEIQSNEFLMDQKRHPNAINVFVVDNCATPNSGPGILAGYYRFDRNWIVLSKPFVGTAGEPVWALGRMLGRYFGLLNTSFGWNEVLFNEDSPGWPVAPAFDNLGRPTEWMNGTNCTVGGDLLCDTPPDYGFALTSNGCAYTGPVQDPGGTPVDPDESNFMSDYLDCTERTISGEQVGLIQTELASPNQTALSNTFAPGFSEIPLPLDWPFSPPDNTTPGSATTVQVSWEQLPETGRYLLELDVVPSFTSPLAQILEVSGNTFTFTNLQPNKTYRWRVRPLAQHLFCVGTSAVHIFKTDFASGTNAPKDEDPAWRVLPNAVPSGAPVQVQFTNGRPLAGQFQLCQFDGQVLANLKATTRGDGSQVLELPNVVPAVYLLTLVGPDGRRSVQRLTVVR